MKVPYTFSQTNTNLFTLYSSLDNSTIEVAPNHPKWAWMQSLSADRIINISTKGAWNSSKDYKGLYRAKPVASKPLDIKFTKLDDLDIDDSLNIPMITESIADRFISNIGGFLPGTNIMVAGNAGVGKTTVLIEMISKLHIQGKKVLFISAEMSQIDMARYLKRFPHWGQIPILFLGDYLDECPKTVIESAIDQGWDMVLTDSYSEINDTVKEACNMSRAKTENWFLTLISEQNKGANKLKKYTCFLTILQFNKGGDFSGSNKLKHLATAMMLMDWEGGENGRRYMEFSKNRCGDVGKKLYYSIGDGVEFDDVRYQRDLLNQEMINEEKQKLKTEEDAFDKLFGSLPTEAEHTELAMEA